MVGTGSTGLSSPRERNTEASSPLPRLYGSAGTPGTSVKRSRFPEPRRQNWSSGRIRRANSVGEGNGKEGDKERKSSGHFHRVLIKFSAKYKATHMEKETVWGGAKRTPGERTPKAKPQAADTGGRLKATEEHMLPHPQDLPPRNSGYWGKEQVKIRKGVNSLLTVLTHIRRGWELQKSLSFPWIEFSLRIRFVPSEEMWELVSYVSFKETNPFICLLPRSTEPHGEHHHRENGAKLPQGARSEGPGGASGWPAPAEVWERASWPCQGLLCAEGASLLLEACKPTAQRALCPQPLKSKFSPDCPMWTPFLFPHKHTPRNLMDSPKDKICICGRHEVLSPLGRMGEMSMETNRVTALELVREEPEKSPDAEEKGRNRSYWSQVNTSTSMETPQQSKKVNPLQSRIKEHFSGGHGCEASSVGGTETRVREKFLDISAADNNSGPMF